MGSAVFEIADRLFEASRGLDVGSASEEIPVKSLSFAPLESGPGLYNDNEQS